MEGEIAYLISKDMNHRIMPLEIIRRKYEPDFRWLWRRKYLELKAKQEEYEEMQENL